MQYFENTAFYRARENLSAGEKVHVFLANGLFRQDVKNSEILIIN